MSALWEVLGPGDIVVGSREGVQAVALWRPEDRQIDVYVVAGGSWFRIHSASTASFGGEVTIDSVVSQADRILEGL